MEGYQDLESNISLTMHFLRSYMSFFQENARDGSDEHAERFHQDIVSMEKKYEVNWSSAPLADFCWNLKPYAPEMCYKRRNKYFV